MRKVAIVQSRMGNTRFPGKNGRMLMGKPQIWHVLSRIKRAHRISDIFLAVPYESNGGIQLEAARDLGIPYMEYRGDASDVLHRYALAADIMAAGVVVRIPGDNTFVEPEEIDRIIEHYEEHPCSWDYLTTNLDFNVLDNGYPGGLGAEVYDSRYFAWLDKLNLSARHREHPHTWAMDNRRVRTIQAPSHLTIRKHPGDPQKYSVDTEEEWEWTKRIYEALYPTNPDFRIRDIFKYLKETDLG